MNGDAGSGHDLISIVVLRVEVDAFLETFDGEVELALIVEAHTRAEPTQRGSGACSNASHEPGLGRVILNAAHVGASLGL